MSKQTNIDALIAEAFKVAKKGVQINDGHTYNVHAHDLVEYSETIMALMDALESTSAELLYQTRTKDAALKALGRYEKRLQKAEAELRQERERERAADLDEVQQAFGLFQESMRETQADLARARGVIEKMCAKTFDQEALLDILDAYEQQGRS